MISYVYICVHDMTCVHLICMVSSPRTEVPIPVSISGLFGCPGYRKGGHVDVMLPTATWPYASYTVGLSTDIYIYLYEGT